MMQLDWQWKYFDDLTPQVLYQLWQLRSAVFIVEQNEIYQDADGKDLSAWHLCGYDHDKALIAYTRVIFPEKDDQPIHFGRVIVKPEYRNKGLARALIKNVMHKITESDFKDYPVEIFAQAHLEKFYGSFGFHQIGEPYYDGKILHITMHKTNL
jgi:ElaA protein